MILTLLELVKDMLAAIDAENVDSVTDTEESQMCVNICNRVYEKLIYRQKWRHLRTQGALVAGAQLNELTGPANTIFLDGENIYYATNRITYVSPEVFLSRVLGRDTSQTNITAINNLPIVTDRNPTYYTSFDDETLVFEAMPTAGGLVAANSDAIYWVGPSARVTTDGGTFNLPASIYTVFEEFCIAVALDELKGDSRSAERRYLLANREFARALNRNDLVSIEKNFRDFLTVRNTRVRPRLITN